MKKKMIGLVFLFCLFVSACHSDAEVDYAVIAAEAYQQYIDQGRHILWADEEATVYEIVDINQDMIPEFLVQSIEGELYKTTLFRYDVISETVEIAGMMSHIGPLKYSEEYNALVYSPFQSSPASGEYQFFVLTGGWQEFLFGVGWTTDENGCRYFLRDGYYGEIEKIDQKEAENYLENLRRLACTLPLPETEHAFPAFGSETTNANR